MILTSPLKRVEPAADGVNDLAPGLVFADRDDPDPETKEERVLDNSSELP